MFSRRRAKTEPLEHITPFHFESLPFSPEQGGSPESHPPRVVPLTRDDLNFNRASKSSSLEIGEAKNTAINNREYTIGNLSSRVISVKNIEIFGI